MLFTTVFGYSNSLYRQKINSLNPNKYTIKALKYIDAVFLSYSEIFFMRNRLVGIMLFLTTLFNPAMALSGITAVITVYLFAGLINMDQRFIDSGFYTYNPLLVGLAIGYLFKLNLLTLFFIIPAAILTFIVTTMLYNIFSLYFKLPVLSIPFTIISAIAYLASSKYSNLYVSGFYPKMSLDVLNLKNQFPLWLAGYFKSLGTIFFLPYILPGIIIAIIILMSSRILFILSVAGYYSGTLFTGLLTGSYYNAFLDINHFNYILIAMAVGGGFLIPSIKSYILAITAVCVSTILVKSAQVFWANFGIPGFTLPFNMVTLSFIYVLGLIHYPKMAKIIKSTPEETLDRYLSNQLRYKGTFRTLSLPFSGKWTVWQGFDGKWTHKGNLKFAYDFIINDNKGKSCRHKGMDLPDYYAYHKPVLSPVAGSVVRVVNHLSDNPIGQVDRTNAWGNLVVIKDDRGFFVTIAHLSESSIVIKTGERVEKGTYIGTCGNSGYSPQPHIHIQVQLTDDISSPTLPFSFTNYFNDGNYCCNDTPKTGTCIEPLYRDRELNIRTSFMLDDRMQFEVFKDKKKTGECKIKVKSGEDGTFYFDSGKGKLYFGKFEDTFYFYSLEGEDENLGFMFQGLSKLPLAYREKLQWEDQIPLDVITGGAKKGFIQFAGSFYHKLTETRSTFSFDGTSKIKGKIRVKYLNVEKKVLVELDEQVGFNSIKIDNIELRRVKNEQIRG